jgi:transposase
LRAAEQHRPDIAEARRRFHELRRKLDPTRLVFLDETWTKTNLTRLRGRSLRGERLVAAVPYGHWKTSTFVAALRHDRMAAPLVLDGAMNGETFRAYVEQFLAPTLAPGEIVLADNLGSHKVAGVREAIEARGASLVFLPAYSPDLNPIEQAFAKLKAFLRKAAPRTRETLWNTIGASLGRFSPTECRNYLAHCGYG